MEKTKTDDKSLMPLTIAALVTIAYWVWQMFYGIPMFPFLGGLGLIIAFLIMISSYAESPIWRSTVLALIILVFIQSFLLIGYPFDSIAKYDSQGELKVARVQLVYPWQERYCLVNETYFSWGYMKDELRKAGFKSGKKRWEISTNVYFDLENKDLGEFIKLCRQNETRPQAMIRATLEKIIKINEAEPSVNYQDVCQLVDISLRQTERELRLPSGILSHETTIKQGYFENF